MHESKPNRIWVIIGCSLLILLIIGLLPARRSDMAPAGTNSSNSTAGPDAANPSATHSLQRRAKSPASSATAEEIVAGKLNQFTRSRRDIAHALARRGNFQVPLDVERFFDAVEAGRWDEMNELFGKIRAQRQQDPPPPGLRELGPVLLETIGVAQEVQKWPAQRLLDYGNSILDSLRPGMIYIGGTDPGRFIPTLLTETSAGERHIVVTQNGLADATYLDYLSFLYGDRISALSKSDSERAFQDYLADAQKRLRHDQEFPNEPKQIRPGEDVRMNENRVQVSGQVAVMAINELLLRALMAKNPDAAFGIEHSFPFTSMYPETSPLGPIMELGVKDPNKSLTPERAAQSVNYWRNATQELFAELSAVDAQPVRMTYGKLIAEQAALLLARDYKKEAEEAFLLATQIAPGSPEAVFRYVNILVEQGRIADAIPIVEAAVKTDPNNQHQFLGLMAELNRKNRN